VSSISKHFKYYKMLGDNSFFQLNKEKFAQAKETKHFTDEFLNDHG